MKTIEDHFTDWEADAFGYGYGTGEEYIIPALHWFFSNLADDRSYDHRNLEARFGPLAAWLLINTLCREDILEYGTSPRFGWLTVKGERLRDFVKSKTADELVALTARGQDYCPCLPEHCNCETDTPCVNPFWREGV